MSGILFVIGSLMPRSRNQLSVLVSCTGIHVETLEETSVYQAADSVVAESSGSVLSGLGESGMAALTTQPSASGTTMPLGTMSRVVGRVVKRVLDTRSLKTLVLVGGDTAFGILDELGISSLKLIYEVLPGVAAAEGVLPDGRVQTIITKSGSYGSDDVFCRLLEGVNIEASV